MVLLKTLAEALTKAQLLAAVEGAIILLYLFVKFVKDFKAVQESFVYTWMQIKCFCVWVMKKAMWRKRMTETLTQIKIAIDRIIEEQQEVKREVKYNGGTIFLSDAVKRLEVGQLQILRDLNEKGQIRNAMQKFSNTMTFHMNAEGFCTFINDAFLHFFGCNENDVLVDAYENMVHEDDLMEMRSKWTRSVEHHSAYRDEQRIRHKVTGKFYQAVVKADPIVVDDELKSFYGTIEIINE